MDTRTRPTTVLVVEDNAFTRQLLEDVFADLQIQMHSAGCAADALRLIDTLGDAITLALVDRLLPDGDGHEICVALRALRPSLPIVQMSGLPLASADISVINATLSKPFDLETLELLVHTFTELDAPGASPVAFMEQA